MNSNFDVSKTEQEVIIRVEREGVEYILKHIVREPTAEEWKEFQRRSWRTVIRGRKLDLEDISFSARNWLYDKICLRVEGYCDKGVPLDMSDDSWKSKIPASHKQQVIMDMARIYSYEGELSKNSENVSEQ